MTLRAMERKQGTGGHEETGVTKGRRTKGVRGREEE